MARTAAKSNVQLPYAKTLKFPFRGYKTIGSFSEKERDRRWKNTRAFMQKNQLDALLVIGSPIDGALDAYLSNWVPANTVLFPLKGEPILLASGLGGLLRIKPDTPANERPWIRDVRVGARGAMIVAALTEKGLTKSRIGVIGAGAMGNRWEGWVPYGTWDRVVKRLPDCEFENVGEAFGETILVKSEEELVHIRRAADVLEQACDAMIKAMRVGATEFDVWAAYAHAVVDNGVLPGAPQFGSGPNVVGSQPVWLHQVGAPRVFEAGDILITELSADCGPCQAQVQQAVALPPVSDVDKECARLAQESYKAGVRALKPGVTFEQVVAAMDAPMERPDVWYQTPPLHSMNPHILIGRTGVNIQKMPGVKNFPQVGTGRIRGGEVVVKTGMVFELEPNACIGMHRVLVGGTVIVTEKEVEELNKLPLELQIAGS